MFRYGVAFAFGVLVGQEKKDLPRVKVIGEKLLVSAEKWLKELESKK